MYIAHLNINPGPRDALDTEINAWSAGSLSVNLLHYCTPWLNHLITQSLLILSIQ
jgi:hypothetical protein